MCAVTITYHEELIQGSEEWLAARCGLLTASEMKLIVKLEGGGSVTKYRATDQEPERLTPKRKQALDAIAGRVGLIRELAFLGDVSEAVIRGLIDLGSIEAVDVPVPLTLRAWPDGRDLAHLYELLAQRITGFVEPCYISDDMLRGMDDEIRARDNYREKYGPVQTCGFVTNDRWGFTIGYSPDWLVGDDGQGEAKSRRQKFQVQTIVENVLGETIPADYVIQHQTGLLVTERRWCDFVSYSGGLPMATIRVWPDPVIQNAIVEAAGAFEARLADKLTAYREAVAKYDRLIPTERTVEQAMYV